MNKDRHSYRILMTLILACCILLPLQQINAKVFPGKEWSKVSPQSQGVDSVKLQKAIDYLTGRLNSAPGGYTGGILVIRNGYVIWENADSHTLYETGSVSKSFLSTGLGLMIDDGIVKLSTLVRDIDPRIGEKYPSATIRHFVTMTSGYDAQHIAQHKNGYDCDPQGKCDTWDPGTPLDPLFAPGTKFRYWDEGEMELSYALGLVGGNPYYVRDLLQKRIVSPIGMQNFIWRDVPTTVGLLPAMNGGLKTNARDLARFGYLFLNRGNWDGKQLISEAWVDAATSVQVPNSIPNDVTLRAKGSGAYGFNWWINGVTPKGKRFHPDGEPSAYWASGYGTNKCFVIPNWNMIIVRTGEKPADWKEADAAFNIFLGLLAEAVK